MSFPSFLTDKIVTFAFRNRNKPVWPKEKDWRPDSSKIFFSKFLILVSHEHPKYLSKQSPFKDGDKTEGRQGSEERGAREPPWCRLEHFPGILFIQRNKVGKPAKQNDCLVRSIFWTFLVNIIKGSFWLWGPNSKPSSVWRASWYQASGMWLPVCSQLHSRWPFKVFCFFLELPSRSLCASLPLDFGCTWLSPPRGSVVCAHAEWWVIAAWN